MHYVYKITNTKPSDKRRYYIGVKTSENAKTDGDFENVCRQNSLPVYALIESVKGQGCPIFETNLKRKRAINRGVGGFIGWYAKIIN